MERRRILTDHVARDIAGPRRPAARGGRIHCRLGLNLCAGQAELLAVMLARPEDGYRVCARGAGVPRPREKRTEAAMMPTAEKKRKREEDAGSKATKKTALEELLGKVRAMPDPEKVAPCYPPFCQKNCPGTAVYDTCDEVRKKSLEFMAATGMTQSAFIKEIGSHPPSWNSFIKMKSRFDGHNPGAGNGCYWGAYNFLEKVRLVRGEKKSAKRLAAEAKHPPREIFNIHGGYRLKNDDGTRWVFVGR